MPDSFELELELATAKEALAHLPADAYHERISARERILELAAAVAEATPIQPDSLRTELARLRTTHRRLSRTRMDPSNANGGLGSSGGIDPNFLHKANLKIDAMTGIAEVEARIAEIERLLDR